MGKTLRETNRTFCETNATAHLHEAEVLDSD